MSKNFTVASVQISKPEVSYPDIDVDLGAHPITKKSKDDVIQYLINKYGEEYVASVGVKSEYKPKSVLRDLGQVYGIPASETFKATKEYSDEYDIHVNIRKSTAVGEFFAKYPFLKEKLQQIVGTVSSLGVHPGGVIISDKSRGYSLYDYCALQRTKDDGKIATLWTKEEVANLGFIKYDILGLSAAGIVHYARELLGLDPYENAPEDEEVFKNIVLCLKHKNIFQFESQLGRQAFEDFLPMSIRELANASGIIRLLGAESGRAVYNDCKTAVDYYQQGNKDWWKEKLYDECEEEENTLAAIEVLKDSYGTLIFQEQLSNLVKFFSKGQKTFDDGNQCRKLLDKHKKKYGTIDDCQGDRDAIKLWHTTFMEILNEFFLPYLGRDGWDSPDEETQDFLNFKLRKDLTLPIPLRGPIKWVLSSAAYLFNKLHSIGYSINGYNMMWLKHYHPKEFWVSSLTCDSGSVDEIRNHMAAINLENPEIKVLSPNVNKSEAIFTIEGNNIRFGMTAINGMGQSAELILEERKTNGQYKSLDDFLQRLKKTKVNKRAMSALLYVNAFEDFGSMKDVWKEFKRLGIELEEINLSEAELSAKEANLIGGNISFFDPILATAGFHRPIGDLQDGENDTCALRILKVVPKTTKTGKPYQLIKISDLNDGRMMNLFSWQVREELKDMNYLIARVSYKNNFYTLLGPSTQLSAKRINGARARAVLK